jgi:uncharacterized protein YgbK (DUF1537 family)
MRPLSPARTPVFVLAGSMSPVTAQQIMHATGYSRVPLSPDRLAAEESYLREQTDRIAAALRDGRNVLAHTTPIGEQPMISSTGSRLASACGALLRALLHKVPLSRVGIAGGDTSSHAVQALAPWGLEWTAAVDAGVALLRAHAEDPRIDGIELMLKGGQMGAADLFDRLVQGRADRST